MPRTRSCVCVLCCVLQASPRERFLLGDLECARRVLLQVEGETTHDGRRLAVAPLEPGEHEVRVHPSGRPTEAGVDKMAATPFRLHAAYLNDLRMWGSEERSSSLGFQLPIANIHVQFVPHCVAHVALLGTASVHNDCVLVGLGGGGQDVTAWAHAQGGAGPWHALCTCPECGSVSLTRSCLSLLSLPP